MRSRDLFRGNVFFFFRQKRKKRALELQNRHSAAFVKSLIPMKKKSFIVSVCAALFALLLVAGCDCCEKKHHQKGKHKTCQSCQCQQNNGNNANNGVVITEEDALLEVVPDTPPANPPAK